MSSVINSTGYDIFIGKNVLQEAANFIQTKKYSSVFILVDENSEKYCLPLLRSDHSYQLLKIRSGEENKNIQTCNLIWNELINSGAERNSLLINLGGGVIGDMGGFSASTYKRGIDFINIPTTLLSQVDASVGGKLGVDLSGIKNIIGLFANPQAVFIYPDFAQTLSQRQFLSGFAEIIKHALIYDPEYWQLLQKNPELTGESLSFIIERSVSIKNEVVKKDPQEKNLRKILNFGHTIGHALETFSLLNDSDPLLHGEAVAAGMICEAYLSTKLAGLTKDSLQAIVKFIDHYYPRYQFSRDNLTKFIDLMRFDKKNENQQINFSLLKEIGEARINFAVSEALISESLLFYCPD